MFCQFVYNLHIFVTIKFDFNDLLFHKVKSSQQKKANIVLCK